MTKAVKNFDAPVSSKIFLKEAKEELIALFKSDCTKVTYISVLQPVSETQELDDGTVIRAPYYGMLHIGNKKCIVNNKSDSQALTRICIDLLNDTLKCLSPWLSTSIMYSNIASMVRPQSVNGYPFMKIKHTFAIKQSAKNLSAAIVQALAEGRAKPVIAASTADSFKRVSNSYDDSVANTNFFG